MATKYGAKYVFWNTINECVISAESAEGLRSGKQRQLPKHIRRFDSQHEFKVYLELVRMYGKHRVKSQVHLTILPPGNCFPRGKTWKVDFALSEPDGSFDICRYVEAKGMITREFCYTLACLEVHKPIVFNNLLLVFPNTIPIENTLIRNLRKTSSKERLLTLDTLKKSRELP